MKTVAQSQSHVHFDRMPRRWVAWLLTVLCGLAALAPGAQAQLGVAWAVGMGGPADDHGRGVAVDPMGNVYTTGYYRSTANFGDLQLTSEGGQDIFVTKHSPDGALLWARSMGGGGIANDAGMDIALDSSGNVYITGYFEGIATFDPGPEPVYLFSSGRLDAFVCKLDTDGGFVWARAMGGVNGERGWGIAVDGAGNVYATGVFLTTANFGPFQLVSAGDEELFVVKLDTDGNYLWARSGGGVGKDFGSDIAVDSEGNVYVTGEIEDTANYGPLQVSSEGQGDIIVTKLDTNGNFLWARSMGGTLADIGLGIAVDAAGNVFTTGYFNGTANFGPIQLTSTGNQDAFVTKHDTDGTFLWAAAFSGPGNAAGFSAEVDAEGNVYTSGYFQGTADFDPGPDTFELSSGTGSAIFVSKLDSNGAFQWAQAMGGPGFDNGTGMTVDDEGDVYVTGRFIGTADFGPFELTSEGGYDIFVTKLSTSPLFAPADINRDGSVDAVDVQLAINAALGIAIDSSYNADINGNGSVDAVDVQLVINAALGVAINP